jgi:hypothetical protein
MEETNKTETPSTIVPKFLQYVTGLQNVEETVDFDATGTDTTFRRKETVLWTEDSEGVKSVKEEIVKHYPPINVVEEFSKMETDLVEELSKTRGEADILDVSASYRRKKDIIDRRRKMAMEGGDKELLELLEGNIEHLLVELNVEMIESIDSIFSKMMLNGCDYVLVSPEVATMLRDMESFNAAKPDLENMTSVVLEGNLKNIMVFTNMMLEEHDRWMMYFGSSRFQRKTFSVLNNLTHVTTTCNLRLRAYKAVRVIGGDVKRSMTMFAPALPKYSLDPIRNREGNITGINIKNDYSDLRRVYPGLRGLDE